MNQKIKVISTLDHTLKKLNLSRYEVALEGRVRPATINDLANGNSKSIKFETAAKIIEGIERISGKRIKIEDILTVIYTKE